MPARNFPREFPQEKSNIQVSWNKDNTRKRQGMTNEYFLHITILKRGSMLILNGESQTSNHHTFQDGIGKEIPAWHDVSLPGEMPAFH